LGNIYILIILDNLVYFKSRLVIELYFGTFPSCCY